MFPTQFRAYTCNIVNSREASARVPELIGSTGAGILSLNQSCPRWIYRRGLSIPPSGLTTAFPGLFNEYLYPHERQHQRIRLPARYRTFTCGHEFNSVTRKSKKKKVLNYSLPRNPWIQNMRSISINRFQARHLGKRHQDFLCDNQLRFRRLRRSSPSGKRNRMFL